jgi:hypothetical protein
MELLLLLTLLVPPSEGSLCTVADPDFDGYRYAEQIPHCERNVSTDRKDVICRRDGVYNRTNYTVDHIIPLSLGGSNHNDNLWCQHKSLAVTDIEYKAFILLDEGALLQKEAINMVLDAKFSPDIK